MAATGVDVGAPRTESAAPASVRRARRVRGPRVLLHAFLIVTVLVWLAPLVWTVYTSLRPYQDTFRLGEHPTESEAPGRSSPPPPAPRQLGPPPLRRRAHKGWPATHYSVPTRTR